MLDIVACDDDGHLGTEGVQPQYVVQINVSAAR